MFKVAKKIHTQEYKPSTEEIKHLDEFLQLMKIFSDDNRFEDVYNEYLEDKTAWTEGGI